MATQRDCASIKFGHILGNMQLVRRQEEGSAPQRACHMLALGPPISEIDPEKPFIPASRLASSRMEASERDAMHRP